ncbi:MAG: DUF732 domain-containing protein [Acidimicrobiales bacterium]
MGRSVVLVAGTAGLTLCLAGGVAVGVVTQAGTSGTAARPAAASSSDDTAAPAAGSAPSAAPSGPTTAARVNPSSAQVQAAIAQIHQRIPLYSPTEAQARQFGDQVCSAFDQGQSSAQVQATAQQMASQIPFVTVSSGDIAFAVRTAVQLFCPGYSSKV